MTIPLLEIYYKEIINNLLVFGGLTLYLYKKKNKRHSLDDNKPVDGTLLYQWRNRLERW